MDVRSQAARRRVLAMAVGLMVCACSRPTPQISQRTDEVPRAEAEDVQASARVADEVRDLLLDDRVEAARAVVRAQVAKSPGDARLRWLAGAAALADGDAEELAVHRAAIAEGSGWGLLLQLQEKLENVPREEAAALAVKARAALDDHPDAVWVHAEVMRLQSDEDGLARLAELPGLPDSVRDYVFMHRVGMAFFRAMAAPPPTRPSEEDLQALVAAAEQAAPTGTLAVVKAAESWLNAGQVEAAAGLVERALARRPDSLALAVMRARVRVAGKSEDTGLRDEVSRELVALAGRCGEEPELLARLAAGLFAIGANEAGQTIQDDVRRRFPEARAVERWDHQAASPFGAVSRCRMGLHTGTLPPAEELAQARAPVDAFFDRPRIRDASLRAATAAALVEFLQCEPTAPVSRVEAVARGVLAARFGGDYDANAAVLLARRGGDLELARVLAERAVAHAHELHPGAVVVMTPTDVEQGRQMMRGFALHARGLVHLRAGRVEEARADITRAHELVPTQPDVALLAAELAERDGDTARAEKILALSIARMGARAQKCRERLSALVRARGQGEADLDRMIARLEGQWREERIAEVLAARVSSPEPLAPFDLELRGGGRISSASLRGRVSVVIATDPWCTGCRLEAPELAKLEERYRGRKDVQFLVVTSDPDGIAALHEGQGFHSQIAKDDGWLHRAGIRGIPTHIFVDAAGREVYRGFSHQEEMQFTYPPLIEAIGRPG